MSICPKCGHHTPTTNEKLRGMFAARVEKSAKVNLRNLDAAHNEMATAMHAINAEDVIDPRSAITPEGFVKLDLERVRAQGWGEFWDAVGRAIDKKYEPRAVGFIEFKPGEEPERFDEATGPMGGGL